MTKPTGFIDPPTPWASVDEWQAHLVDMEKIAEPRGADVKEAITEAKAKIAALVGS